MIEKFFNILPLLKEHEIPGRESWNTLIEFLRKIDTACPFITFRSRQPKGMYIDLDLGGLYSLSAQSSFGIPPAQIASSEGSYKISGGTVRWPNGGTKNIGAISISKVAGSKVWVEISKSKASMKAAMSWPSWIEKANTTSLTYNFPILELIPSDQGYIVPKYHHIGDINITAMPAEWVNGYAPGKNMSRDIEGGQEVYTEYEECETEE